MKSSRRAITYLIIFTVSVSAVPLLYLNTGFNATYGQNLSSTSGTTSADEALDLLYLQKLYESPTTIVLRGEGPHFEPLGKAIDNAKQNGFSIDSVTVFTQQSQAFGTTRYLTDTYTVFMSKK